MHHTTPRTPHRGLPAPHTGPPRIIWRLNTRRQQLRRGPPAHPVNLGDTFTTAGPFAGALVVGVTAAGTPVLGGTDDGDGTVVGIPPPPGPSLQPIPSLFASNRYGSTPICRNRIGGNLSAPQSTSWSAGTQSMYAEWHPPWACAAEPVATAAPPDTATATTVKAIKCRFMAAHPSRTPRAPE